MGAFCSIKIPDNDMEIQLEELHVKNSSLSKNITRLTIENVNKINIIKQNNNKKFEEFVITIKYLEQDITLLENKLKRITEKYNKDINNLQQQIIQQHKSLIEKNKLIEKSKNN